MSKVAIVTDSTANIPAEHTKGLPIHVLPLQVLWEDKVYLDGIDITPTEFYKRLKTAKTMPTTSQATPAQFQEKFSSLLEQGYDILCILISSKLSGTMDSAIQAKEHFPNAKIELFDSLSSSMAMGFQILTVARAAAEGASLSECRTLAELSRSKVDVFFVVSTLEFLHRGGRIGGATAFLGTALNLKPILSLRDGQVIAIERVRTMGKALDRLLDLYQKGIDGDRPIRVSALHANAPEEAKKILERAQQLFHVSDIHDAILAEVSPVIGTHTGPGTIGLAFLAGM